MKTLIKKMIFWGMILFLLGGGTPGCKGKGDQEDVEGEQRAKKKEPKETLLEIGNTLKYWTYSLEGATTQFSMTFDCAFVSNTAPWDMSQTKLGGKKYLIVYGHIDNMGPREDSPLLNCIVEVKMHNGFIYPGDELLFASVERPPTTRFDPDDWKLSWHGEGHLKAGEKAWCAFFSVIPEEGTPVELLGKLDSPGIYPKVKLRLILPIKISDTGEVQKKRETIQAEEKVLAEREIKKPGKKISKESIPGRYLVEATEGKETKIARVKSQALVNDDLKCEARFSVAIVNKKEFEEKYKNV